MAGVAGAVAAGDVWRRGALLRDVRHRGGRGGWWCRVSAKVMLAEWGLELLRMRDADGSR